ncbi:hypothetical protein N0V94_007218 [Neodidymelliopsis sp. IMI 364377]|nr:hypothetical protein N0V94_007218 [Neodidymelliopsis sp. IMI 364377]
MSALNLGLLLTALAVFNNAAPTAEMGSASLVEAGVVKHAGPCAFSGRIDLNKLAAELPACTSIIFDSIGFAGPLLSIGGKDIIITGETNAKLDGQGAQYWDGLGISRGSTVASNTVSSNVKFLNSTVTGSTNGIRIKSFYDGKGTIDKVTYSGITLRDISKYGILIEQTYDGEDPSKTHGPGTGVPISGLTIQNIVDGGSVSSTGINVDIECANCSGWTWNTVTVDVGKKFSCQGAPSVVPSGTCA